MTLGNAALARRRPAVNTVNRVACRVAEWADARLTWLSLAGSIAVVVLLYGRALRYAFFFDDTYDLTRTEGRSYLSLLTSSKGYSYYRPIPFLIWKLLRSVQGHYDQSTLHTLPLISHALAGWLLFLLVRRLGAGAWALIPALLFLTFPFDYQAVPISGTLFHPLAGAAVLAALLGYQLARDERAPRRRLALNVAAVAATFVALWSHESGVVVAPLIVGLDALFLSRTKSRRPSPWALAHVLAMALFVFVWYSVEKAPSTESTNVSELHPKVLYLLQGFTYPFSAQLIWLDEHLGWTPGVLQIAMPAIAIGAGAYVVAGWRSGKRGKALASSLAVPGISLIVSLIAFIPALTRLSYAYVEDSPRLLYMVGIGAAVFWGLLPALDFHHSAATRIWRMVTLLLLAGVFLQSWRFVDVRMTMLARGSEVIAQVVAAGEQFRGEPVVFINAPAWFSRTDTSIR